MEYLLWALVAVCSIVCFELLVYLAMSFWLRMYLTKTYLGIALIPGALRWVRPARGAFLICPLLDLLVFSVRSIGGIYNALKRSWKYVSRT